MISGANPINPKRIFSDDYYSKSFAPPNSMSSLAQF